MADDRTPDPPLPILAPPSGPAAVGRFGFAISVQVPTAEVAHLRELAQARGLSTCSLIRQCLADALRRGGRIDYPQ
jgi:ribbon-helix-helix CopG family protein